MRIALLSQYFDQVLPPDQNSVGIWTYEVARLLDGDADTTVLSRRLRGQPPRIDINNASVQLLSCAPMGIWSMASRAWSQAHPPSQPLFAQRFYALDFLTQAIWRIRRIQPDVIHIQNFPQFASVIRRVAPRAAIILHMHCDWLVQLDLKAMTRGVVAADLVAGCSAHVAETARRRFAHTGVPFAVLPNGAPVERMARVAVPRIGDKVLFVGRVSPEKGIHTLLEAWTQVVAARPAARLDIVGPAAETPRELLVDLSDEPTVRRLSRFYLGRSKGSYIAALRGMLDPRIAHTVTFIDHEPYERLIERYATASLLVNPSLSESFGMSLVEALATGTPIVATRVGGMPEIVEATGGGILADKDDPTALAEVIIRLLSNRKLATEFGQRGARRVAELYSWGRVAKLTRDLYDQALLARHTRQFGPTSTCL